MEQETIPCGALWCDVYLITPWKEQCSYEGTGKCGAQAAEVLDNIMDKTKILVTNKESFNEIKNLESEIQRWKKIADDWRQAAIALATDAGDPYLAIDCYEDISSGLCDTVRERMYVSPSTKQRAFDGIHDYATLICTKAGEAQELRVAAEDVSDAENTYYWEGYEAALDFAIDSLPNYNNSGR
jgi:cell division septum initiation protein DivIVA